MAATAAVVGVLLPAPPLAAQEPLAANPLQTPYASALSDLADPELQEALADALEDGPRLSVKRVGELLARWRDVDNGPVTGTDWALVARLWRQAGEPDSTFRALERADRAGGAPAGLLSLEEARSAFLAGRPEVGAEAYWEGCHEADPVVQAEYRRDFAAVQTPAEAEEWNLLKARRKEDPAPQTPCDLLRRAWGERAARAGLSVADRLALHYERLRHARERYHLVRERMRLGPRTRLLSLQVGRPDLADLDDRGLVYVRLGEPDRRTGFGGGNQFKLVPPDSKSVWLQAAYELQVSSECFHPNESWAYDYPDGTRVYHFSPLEGTADWFLLENLADAYACGDPSGAVTITRFGPVVGILTPISGGGLARPEQVAWLVLGDLYMSRVGLDSEYGTLAYRLVMSTPQPGETRGLLNMGPGALDAASELFEERQTNFEAAEVALTSIPDRPVVRPEVRLLYELLQFRGASDTGSDVTKVWLNAVAQGEGLRGEPAEDGDMRYRVRAMLNLVGEQGEVWTREVEFALRSEAELGGETGVPVRLALDLPAGEYGYTLVIRDANDEREQPAGNWRTDSMRVRSYAARVPQLSDVAFAPDSGRGWSPAPGMALPASPVHRTNRTGQAWLYFEAYGLSPAGDYVTEVRLEPEGRGEPFMLTYAGAPPASEDETVRRVLRLELGDTEPGDYEVRITVTDALGRASLPLETSLNVIRTEN